MEKLHKKWFDTIQINFNQSTDGFIGIHAFKKEYGCVYFEVPITWADSDDFFGMVYERTKEIWAQPRVEGPEKCPVCNHRFMPFHFRYKGIFFCRWCGSHYKLDGNNIIMIRRIDGKQLVR